MNQKENIALMPSCAPVYPPKEDQHPRRRNFQDGEETQACMHECILENLGLLEDGRDVSRLEQFQAFPWTPALLAGLRSVAAESIKDTSE